MRKRTHLLYINLSIRRGKTKMKNTLMAVLTFTFATASFGQVEPTPAEQQELKLNTMSASALWTMFGFLHANYGKVIKEGKNEYQFMLGTFGYQESYTGDDAFMGL